MCRPIFGGNWNNAANCGSRASNWNNSALNLNANIGARGTSDTFGKRPKLKPKRLNIQAILRENTQKGGSLK